MEPYINRLKILEKSLEKNLDKLETHEDQSKSFDLLPDTIKFLEELKQELDKIKTLSLTKHEEIYYNSYLSNYIKLKTRLQNTRNALETKKMHRDLIGNGASVDTTHIDILLEESKNLDSSLQISQSILSTAQDVKASLSYQKDKILTTTDKIVKFVETIPGISSIIGKISRRKRFNAIVIGITLFICLLITIIYLSY
jgi:Snare region anchored in the vesicle membrane C-terminus